MAALQKYASIACAFFFITVLLQTPTNAQSTAFTSSYNYQSELPYLRSGTGHRRAQLFASAMTGDLSKKEIYEKISKTRNQDYLRSLGLVELDKKDDKDLIERYEIIQRFIKDSKQFGAQRQASEKLASQIALNNLASNADFSDSTRMGWYIEGKTSAGIKDYSASIDDLKLAIRVKDYKISLEIEKNGKSIKNIPPKYKKIDEIKEISEKVKHLKNQVSRISLTLEEIMCTGQKFKAKEIESLLAHPLLGEFFQTLIFVSKIDDTIQCGLYIKNMRLSLHDNTQIDLTEETELQIAHVYDIYKSNTLAEWQKVIFDREIKQPFKQVFRELYFLNSDEINEPVSTRRYAGNQVQVRQAQALFRARHWYANPEEGIRKIYRDHGIVAEVYFTGDLFTPGDIEGLTLEGVRFYTRSDYKNVKVTDVPPLIFSECMRDLDLVVSVAHSGGVDPESSLSTIEMRKALIKETARLLNMNNLEYIGNFISIKGELADYSIHMGSGVVHKAPGGMMHIIAIQSAHRGRIFLPFADNDPKTAEIISKVILFAQDKEIKDPTILSQIVA